MRDTGMGTVLPEAQHRTEKSRQLLQRKNGSDEEQEAAGFCEGPAVDKEGVRRVQGKDQRATGCHKEEE